MALVGKAAGLGQPHGGSIAKREHPHLAGEPFAEERDETRSA